VRDLDLPRGCERELVRERDRTYALNGADSQMLATVGAFRVVSERDLAEGGGLPREGRASLSHLRDAGLIRTVPCGPNDRAVCLTERGRDILEASRRDLDRRPEEARQTFCAGLRKPRELTHDVQVYRAYVRAEARLRSHGGRVRRVVLDYELKREYQRFLQARNRGRKASDGRPDREAEEIRLWARDHDLPYFDEQIHLPDLRIEYDDHDGRSRHEDVEVTTGHYRGGHAAAAVRSGFTRYRSLGGVSGGRGGRGRRGGSRLPRVAEEFL